MRVPDNEKSPITIYQMVEEDGTPHLACHTETLWTDRTETGGFALPTMGNKISPFTTGEMYFNDLIVACSQAEKEIYITGWQVNWDALLSPNMRLYDLIYASAKRGVNIYIMPWNDTEPVQTYDDQTNVIFTDLNKRLSTEGAKGKVFVNLSTAYASVNNNYFSHHQKQVLIDRKIAYVGGIDLAYGRFDDATYDLHANAKNRQVLNRYNPSITGITVLSANDTALVDPDLMTGPMDTAYKVGMGGFTPSNAKMQSARAAAGGWQVRYAVNAPINNSKVATNTPDYTVLDPTRQPRMPWQDVHCKIEGAAVFDLLRNFILRWNTSTNKKLPLPEAPNQSVPLGQAQIQVLRSAPAAHIEAENKANNLKSNSIKQQDIHVTMINLIAKARLFIYIENQFFVSAFGVESGVSKTLSPAGQYIKTGANGLSDKAKGVVRAASDGNDAAMNQPPQNGVLKALLQRFKAAIVDDVTRPKFHVYITLPVHPEGSLDNASIAGQVYYTMQTIAFGSNSLLNGIKRCIKARELKDARKDKSDGSYKDVIDNPNNLSYQSVPTEACFEYVTLLNLRNWAKLDYQNPTTKTQEARYVTEQIYVHSKVMIVDDRFALLGSANINDRSLLGERDSEIAVLVMDEESKRENLLGDGCNQPVRLFAHNLRVSLWNKLFGITSNVRPANHLKTAIEQPGKPESWRAIQQQAKNNAAAYEAAFPFVPRSWTYDSKGVRITAKNIPTWDPEADPPTKAEWGKEPSWANEGGNLGSPMPFQPQFWAKPQHNPKAVAGLEAIKGFITALPVEWTKGENLNFGFPTALLVQNAPLSNPTEMAGLNQAAEPSRKV